MSTEQLFRHIIIGDQQATLLPGVDLYELVQTLDAYALGELTVDVLRFDLDPDDGSELQQRAIRVFRARCISITREFNPSTANKVIQLIKEGVLLRNASKDQKYSNYLFTYELELIVEVVRSLNVEFSVETKKALASLMELHSFHNTLSFSLCAIVGIPLQHTTPVHATDHGPIQAPTEEYLFRNNELYILNSLATEDSALCLEIAQSIDRNTDIMDDDQIDPPGYLIFAQSLGYVEQSRSMIEKALAHANSIQTGKIAFKADKAFAKQDSDALARFINVALDREEPWLAPLLEPLLNSISIAPDPAAKSAPSQAATYAIAKAIAERPTYSAWLILKELSTNVRHATLKKRLQKLCKKAEQRLTSNASFLRCWPADQEIPRAMAAGVKSAFEKILIIGDSFTEEEFTTLLSNKGLLKVASTLIWTLEEPDCNSRSFSIVSRKNNYQLADSNGENFTMAAQSKARLLHPLEASSSELEHWREWMLTSKVKQPFNQLFRETYQDKQHHLSENVSSYFSNYQVDANTLIGLSRAAGWHLTKYDGFRIKYGTYLFVFDCGELYPGYSGIISSGTLTAFHNDTPINWAKLPQRIFSEAYRATDLLVSVSAFAIAESKETNITKNSEFYRLIQLDIEDQPSFVSASVRINLLKRLYPHKKNATHPYIDGRYLCLGDVRIHCATARASRLGETVEIEPLKGAAQLPYPDKILERIIRMTNAKLLS